MRQVHVSGHNSESKHVTEMIPYQGHDGRGRGYGGSCQWRQATLAPQAGRAFPRVPQEFSHSYHTTTTTADFASDCSSGIAKSCVLVLVHPHPPLCAGAYFCICITGVSKFHLDDGVSPTVCNPRRIHLRAQKRTTRKRIHRLNLMITAVAPAGARAYLLGQ